MVFHMHDIEYYIEQAAHSLDRCTYKNEKYHFRCNICHDSERSLRKKRGWITKSNGKWGFHCYNCGAHYKSITQWLKKYFPTIYQDYLRSSLHKRITNDDDSTETLAEKTLIEESVNVKEYYKDCKFEPILSESYRDTVLFKDAKNLCTKRRIPTDIWHKFYVCTKGKLAHRIIIPFYSKAGKIEWFTARNIYKHMPEPKYLNCIGPKKIYNIDFVDKTKEIVIVEGPLDSTFWQNGIAVSGLSVNLLGEYLDLKLRFILDNDSSGNITAMKLLNKGYYVFVWGKFLKDKGLMYSKIKDVNDLYLAMDKHDRFEYNELSKYFTNNRLDGIYFQ